MTHDTVMALVEQCKTHTQINLSRLYTQEIGSEGSMMSDSTDAIDEIDILARQADTRQPDQGEEVQFDTCSDGSVYEFTNGNTAAGYAAVKLKAAKRQNERRSNLAPHPTQTSNTAVLN